MQNISPKTTAGVVVGAGKMMKTVKVRMARQEWNRHIRKVGNTRSLVLPSNTPASLTNSFFSAELYSPLQPTRQRSQLLCPRRRHHNNDTRTPFQARHAHRFRHCCTIRHTLDRTAAIIDARRARNCISGKAITEIGKAADEGGGGDGVEAGREGCQGQGG